MSAGALLTERHLLLAYSENNNVKLSAIDIHSPRNKTGIWTLDDLQHVYLFKLHFPELYHDCVVRSMKILSQRSGYSIPVSYSVDAEHMFILYAGYDEEIVACLIPLSAILRLVNQTNEKKSFSWQEWGSHGTRLLRYTGEFEVDAFGSTVFLAHQPYWQHIPDALPHQFVQCEMLDFGVAGGCAADVATGAKDEVTARVSVQHNYGKSKIFPHDIATLLPVRITQVTMDLGDDTSELIASFLGDDCVGLLFDVSAAVFSYQGC